MERTTLLSIGMGALLILGIVGGAGSVAASSENPLDVGLQEDDDTGAEQEGEEQEGEEMEEEEEEQEEEEEPVDVSQLNVSAQQAIAIAENETNGTVVGLELTTEVPSELGVENVSENESETETQGDTEVEAENETETEDDLGTANETENETLVWEVELVTHNGTEHEVFVDATDGTVLGVQTETAEQAANGAEDGEDTRETETEDEAGDA